MTDYRPLLSKIVRLADRGTFSLYNWGSEPGRRWEAMCFVGDEARTGYGRDPGIAVRRLLALLEKERRS